MNEREERIMNQIRQYANDTGMDLYNEGYDEGYKEGENHTWDEARNKGYDEGWEDACEHVCTKIVPPISLFAMPQTKEHYDELITDFKDIGPASSAFTINYIHKLVSNLKVRKDE